MFNITLVYSAVWNQSRVPGDIIQALHGISWYPGQIRAFWEESFQLSLKQKNIPKNISLHEEPNIKAMFYHFPHLKKNVGRFLPRGINLIFF